MLLNEIADFSPSPASPKRQIEGRDTRCHSHSSPGDGARYL